MKKMMRRAERISAMDVVKLILVITVIAIGLLIMTRTKENEKLINHPATVTYSTLNVRDDNGKVIGQLHNGNQITLTGLEKFDMDYVWYQINYEGGVAWVADKGIMLSSW